MRICHGLLIMLAAHGALAAAQAPASAAAPRTIHVATDGDDRSDGTGPGATGDGHGPVKTLERAAVLARSLRMAVGGPIDIVLHGGTYTLSRPLALGPEDSGSLGAPIVYRAADNEAVTLSGGTAVTGWQPSGNGEWTAKIDLAAFGGVCPSQFFVDGERRKRPQWPRTGTVETVSDTAARGRAPKTSDLEVQPLNLPPNWRVTAETEFLMFNAWRASRFWTTGYDAATDTLTLNGALNIRKNRFQKTVPFLLDNVQVDRLDPGRWQCDPAQGTIRYRPAPGEDLGKAATIAPNLDRLLVLKGTSGAPIHDVTFKGLIFEYPGWRLPKAGWYPTQAEYGLTAAIAADFCQSIAFEGITVRHTGAAAIQIGKACVDSEIADSRFLDLGGGAITVGIDQRHALPDSDWTGGTTSPVATSNIRILRNRIEGLGRIQRSAVGIRSAQADHVTISGNHIRDLFYSGISVGWFFHDQPNLSYANRVEGNVIEDYGQGALSDMGGIYTLGRQDGTVVSGNRISGGRARDYGGFGLYADQGSAGITFRENVVSDTSQASIMTHQVGQLSFVGNRLSGFGSVAIDCANTSPTTNVAFVGTVISGDAGARLQRGCDKPIFQFKPPLAK